MASAILLFVSTYIAAGALFGVAFLWRGVERTDPAARGAPFTFRLLILPGVIAFWPLLAKRWHRALRAASR